MKTVYEKKQTDVITYERRPQTQSVQERESGKPKPSDNLYRVKVLQAEQIIERGRSSVIKLVQLFDVEDWTNASDDPMFAAANEMETKPVVISSRFSEMCLSIDEAEKLIGILSDFVGSAKSKYSRTLPVTLGERNDL